MPNINIPLPEGLYFRFIQAKRRLKIGTHPEFIDHLLTLLEDEAISVDFLSVDGSHAAGHEVVFRLGLCIYIYRDGKFELVPEEDAEKMFKEMNR